jgi:hypothetical protein
LLLSLLKLSLLLSLLSLLSLLVLEELSLVMLLEELRRVRVQLLLLVHREVDAAVLVGVRVLSGGGEKRWRRELSRRGQ